MDSRQQITTLALTDDERWELYAILDIRQKLAKGQVYIVPGRIMSGPPKGDFPPGTRSQMIEIRITVNEWFLCYAHRYVLEDGTPYTEPDPKLIRIDELVFKQA
ncbi:MAG: hypothetical protein J4O09_08585 [Chloroflexi bacterium]|nr:hypothetical protein [Chloroflexota bacterium]